MDAIRHHTVAHHVGMIHAGTGFLLPRGIVVSLQARENVAGHVPHVSNAGRGLTAQADRWQGALGVFVVPQMDAVMMTGMVRVLGEDGSNTFLDVIVIFLSPHITIKGENMKGLSFKVIG